MIGGADDLNLNLNGLGQEDTLLSMDWEEVFAENGSGAVSMAGLGAGKDLGTGSIAGNGGTGGKGKRTSVDGGFDPSLFALDVHWC